MKKVFLFSAILFLNFAGFSQDLKIIKVPQGARVESTTVIDGVTTHSYSSGSKIPVNGIPFLDEHFVPGVLELRDGRKSEEVLLRYSIAKDVFEILQNNDTLTLNRPDEVKYVYLQDKIFIYDPKLREKTERKQNGFFELRVDGKCSLFIKRNKDLSYDSFATNYQGGSGTKEYYYINKVTYIGKNSDGKAFLLNSSKIFIANCKEHKAEVKAYIKDQKIKFKNEDDLVKLVTYYNKL
jgi:hypothetical protein